MRRTNTRTRSKLRNRAHPILLLACLCASSGSVLRPAAAATAVTFPNLTFYALDKARVTIPSQLEGQTNLLLLSFASDQQNQLETWTATTQALQHTQPAFRAYRLPVADRENALFRWWVTASIRSEETDPELWHWVVPIFVDKPALLTRLNIADEKSVVALLVDRSGRVLWRATGASTAETRKALMTIVGSMH